MVRANQQEFPTPAMSLTEFLTEVFCLVDDILIDLKHDLRESGDPLRSRGPSPTVSDSVVLTCELAGEFLGRDTDKGLFQYFRRHHQNLFPKLGEVPRRLLPGRRRTCGRLNTCFVAACCAGSGSVIAGKRTLWPRTSALPTAFRCRFAG